MPGGRWSRTCFNFHLGLIAHRHHMSEGRHFVGRMQSRDCRSLSHRGERPRLSETALVHHDIVLVAMIFMMTTPVEPRRCFLTRPMRVPGHYGRIDVR